MVNVNTGSVVKRVSIAVYGSLRKGEAANNLIEGADDVVFLGEAKVRGRLYHLGWYPGVIVEGSELDDRVTVDVYSIPEKLLKSLDRYEGYYENNESSSLFLRRTTLIEDVGDSAEVHIYYYNNSRKCTEDNRVFSGDWTKREVSCNGR